MSLHTGRYFCGIVTLSFACVERFPAMRAECPVGFHNPAAPGTVTLQGMTTFRAAQKSLFHITTAAGTLFFPVVPPTYDKDDNNDDQQGEEQHPENLAMINIPAMPCRAPGTEHSFYLVKPLPGEEQSRFFILESPFMK
ncbi:MAG: hypothetical protein DSY58_03255 [Desulfobulbus sp.]|nr:MAG: hypothetical protein DSY58_03255 [Desulfobulbus sp.]